MFFILLLNWALIFWNQLNRNDTEYLNQQNEELSIRLNKYEQRLKENEEQNDRHLHLEERMKERLKEMTIQFEELNEKVIWNNNKIWYFLL